MADQTPNWKKKYDVEIYFHDDGWSRAILTCHCGKSPERRTVDATHLAVLLNEVTRVLLEHERGHA